MIADDIFERINAAVLDLQGATLQTYERPLKRLGQLLGNPELSSFNEALSNGLDLNTFLEESAQTGGSFVGGKRLVWPDDPDQDLGMRYLLVRHLADNPSRAIHFSHDFYYTGQKVISGIHTMTSQLIIPFVRDYKKYVAGRSESNVKLMRTKSDKVFIVHGHDGEARESVARFLERIELTPIILHEQANRGRTVIEKVEAHSDVGFAVVLLTADDEGRPKDGNNLEPRARQNVLLELGYFLARLGRENVCTFKKGQVEIPSDFAGVVWSAMDSSGAWKQELAKELRAAGYNIDWNLVMT